MYVSLLSFTFLFYYFSLLLLFVFIFLEKKEALLIKISHIGIHSPNQRVVLLPKHLNQHMKLLFWRGPTCSHPDAHV